MSKLSHVINTHNEGDDLKSTIKSFRDECLKHAWEYEAVVIADATTDGSADNLPEYVIVIKNEERLGCGKCKAQGVEKATGDFIWHTDGHNVLHSGDFIGMVQYAIDNACVVTPAVGPVRCKHYRKKGDKGGVCSEGMEARCSLSCTKIRIPDDVPNNCYQGGKIITDTSDGLAVKLTVEKPSEAITQSDSVNYSAFGYPNDSLKDFAGWHKLPGLWGSQEMGFSVRLKMAGIPIYNFRDVVVLHKYRDFGGGACVAPYDIPDGHRKANQMYVPRVCFDDATWNTFWKPWFEARNTPEAAWELLEESDAVEQHKEMVEVKALTDKDFWENTIKMPDPLSWEGEITGTKGVLSISGGLGNAIMTIPAQKALYQLTGQPIDLIDEGVPQDVKELFELQSWVGQVHTEQPDPTQYKYFATSYWTKIPFFLPPGAEVGKAEQAFRTKHEVESNMDAVRSLGYKGFTPSIQLDTWRGSLVLPLEFIVIGVGSRAFKGKSYPYWEDVCKELVCEGHSIVFLGAENDSEEWMETYGLNLCGQTTLSEAAHVLWRARLYVGVDNGLSHLAVSCGITTLALYGPSQPRKNSPWGLTGEIIATDFACAPCWGRGGSSLACSPGDSAPCMASITPERVLNKIKTMINRPGWLGMTPKNYLLSRKQFLENIEVNWKDQKLDEITEEIRILRESSPATVMEIGARAGAWLYMVGGSIAASGSTLFSVDIKPKDKLKEVRDKLAEEGYRVPFLKGNSLDSNIVRQIHSMFKVDSVDVLHIDGDHTKPREDFNNYKDLVRPGGFIVFHDAVAPNWPKITELVKELSATHWSVTIADGSSKMTQGVCIVRKPLINWKD